MKKFISLIIAMIFLTSVFTSVYANDSVSKNETILKGQEATEYAKENGIELEKDGKKLKEIIIKRNKETNDKVEVENIKQNSRDVIFKEFIKKTWKTEGCGTKVIEKASATGGMTVRIEVRKVLSATFSSNVSIGASIVSAGVGYDVNKQYHVADSASRKVSSNKSVGVIQARPLYSIQHFDVYHEPWFKKPKKVGSGSSKKPIGVCFSFYEK